MEDCEGDIRLAKEAISSISEDAIINAYSNHAGSFITKPINGERFIDEVKSIEDFWLII